MSDLGLMPEADDISDVLQNLADRMSEVENQLTSPDVMTGPDTNVFPTGITVGTTPVTDAPPTPPTSITVLASTFVDDIVADISWTGGSGAVEYQVEVAWKNGATYELAQQLRTGGGQVRVVGLRPDSTYGVRVYPINRIGVVGTPYPSPGWQDFSTTHDSTTPGLPTGFTLTAGVRSIVAVWAGVADVDVKNGQGQYELTIATNSGFTTGVRSKFFGGDIGGYTDLLPQTTYWLKVRAVDATGNAGPYTAAASITTAAVITGDMAVNSVDATVIANGTILNAKIGDAEITNAKIVSLQVDKVTAGNIAAKDFNLLAGGQIKTASLTPGIVLNSQGLSLYDSFGTRTVFLDALTGAGTFSGTVSASIVTGSTFQTTLGLGSGGPQGTRIGPSFGGIELFSGMPAETGPAKILANYGADPYLRIEGPRKSGGGAPQPYIDLIGGTGSIGTISMVAGSDIFVSGATSVQLRWAGNTKFTVNANGLHSSAPLWMQDNILYLRSYADTNHAFYWTNGGVGDQIAYLTSTSHRLYVGGALKFSVLTGEVNCGPQYLYVHSNSVRIGEVYGNHGIYNTTGSPMRFDGGSGGLWISNASANIVSFQTDNWFRIYGETAMSNAQSLCWRAAGDYNHRTYYHSGYDGVMQVGYYMSGNSSVVYDVMIEAGHFSATNRNVNNASNAWRDSDAGFHWNNSDPTMKDKIRPLRAGPRGLKAGAAPADLHLDIVKKVKPIRFEWKAGQASGPGRDHFSFDASELPAEVKKKSKLAPGGLAPETEMMNTTGMLAILWAAVQELEEKVAALSK